MNDKTKYHIESTSRSSAVVRDVSLNEEGDQGTTRRILRATIVDNPKNADARVKATLIHQRRASTTNDWQDVDSYNLAELRAGQEVRLNLDSAQTLVLWKTLDHLFAVGADGVPMGKRDLVVLDIQGDPVLSGRVPDIVNHLLLERDTEFWELVRGIDPQSLRDIAVSELAAERKHSYEDFRAQLQADNWTEPDWQRFFEANTWIFGFGLAYQFLRTATPQADYGGTGVQGTGAQRGDFLLATEADTRFTVLVDIKTPNSPLLATQDYRNAAYPVSRALAGGVAQLQANCRTWVVEGSQREQNRRSLDANNVHTYEPKSILVAGHTNQLKADPERAMSFELFRRNLRNPEILTFDELLERAKFVVSKEPEPLLAKATKTPT